MRLLISISLLLAAITCSAQVESAASNLRSVLGSNGKKAVYRGQVVSDKRNGMAFLVQKDGSVYFGDVVDGKPSGIGVQLYDDGKELTNCPESSVYVGRFKDGKKQGNGRCYDSAGVLMHEGKFANDAPVDSYGVSDFNPDKRFVAIHLENGNSYIGETVENRLNGCGVMVMSDGELLQGVFKQGGLDGIGLFIEPDGEWVTIQAENGKNMKELSSSANYKSLRSQRKASNREFYSQILTQFLSDTETFLGNVQQFREERAAKLQTSENASVNEELSENSGSSKKKNKVASKKAAGSDDCRHCYGTGNCDYCNGDGFNYVAGNPVRCTACSGLIGKCKWCKGLGKK